MEWLKDWTKDQLADYFVAARGLMNDKAGAITDRDWSTLNGKITRPISEMKQLRDSFGHLILAEESTPEQFITAVQNRDVTEFDVHRPTSNTSKMRRNTKLSARAAEGVITEEVVRNSTRSAKRAAATARTLEPLSSIEKTYFPTGNNDLADSTDDVARVLAFGLGSVLPAPAPAPTRTGRALDGAILGSFPSHDALLHSDDYRLGLAHSSGASSSTPSSGPPSTAFLSSGASPLGLSPPNAFPNNPKKTETRYGRPPGRKNRSTVEMEAAAHASDLALASPTPSSTLLPSTNPNLSPFGAPSPLPTSHSLNHSLLHPHAMPGASSASTSAWREPRYYLPPVNTSPLVDTLLKALEGQNADAVRRWCMYEWFYPNLDQDWFQQSDFLSMLHSLRLGRLEVATKAQWNLVRRACGKPRRMSKRFFEQEREKLEQHRSYVRMLRPRGPGTIGANSSATSNAPSNTSNSANDGTSVQTGAINTSTQGIEFVMSHASGAKGVGNHDLEEVWPTDVTGATDVNTMGIRVGLGTLGATNAMGVGYIAKDKSQVIPKGTRVLVWTRGIISTRPSATAVHSAAARKGKKVKKSAGSTSSKSANYESSGTGSAASKTSSFGDSNSQGVTGSANYMGSYDDDEGVDSDSEEELSLDEMGEETSESQVEGQEAASSSTSSKLKPPSASSTSQQQQQGHQNASNVLTTISNAKPWKFSAGSMDLDLSSSANNQASSNNPGSNNSSFSSSGSSTITSAKRSQDPSLLIQVPSEGRSGTVVFMPSEVIPGRVVKCKKDNTYQVQLAGALENGSHVVTVDDVHIMSCDVNRAMAKKRSAVMICKVEFNRNEVKSRIHPTAAATNPMDLLQSVMLQTPHFFEPDYNLTAIVMLLLDWKEVALNDMGKALENMEKGKRTLDAVDAGTKTLAPASITTLRNKYRSNERALISLTERLHLINEQLDQYRPKLVERRNMVASSHLVASAVQSARTLSNVAISMTPAPTSWTTSNSGSNTASNAASNDSKSSSSSSSSSSTINTGQNSTNNTANPTPTPDLDQQTNSIPIKIESSASEKPQNEVKTQENVDNEKKEDEIKELKSTSSMDVDLDDKEKENSKMEGSELDAPAQESDLLNNEISSDGVSIGKSPEKDADLRRLEDESMMTLTEMLTATPTKMRAVASSIPSIPLAIPVNLPPLPAPNSGRHLRNGSATPSSAGSGQPSDALLGSQSAFPWGYDPEEPALSPSTQAFWPVTDPLGVEKENETVRDRVASALALLKVLAHEGINPEVREATVKVALNIMHSDHFAQNDALFDAVRAQCDEILVHLASAEQT